MRLHPVAQQFGAVCVILDEATVSQEEIRRVKESATKLQPKYHRAGKELVVSSSSLTSAAPSGVCGGARVEVLDDKTLIALISRSDSSTVVKLRRGKYALDAKWPPKNLSENVSRFLLEMVSTDTKPNQREASSVREESDLGALAPLKSSAILQRIRGNKITPDPLLKQYHVDFSEEFKADGTWITHRSERGPVVRTGKWAVRNNEICVAVASDKPQCRKVWVHVASGKIALADVGSSVGTILVMNTSQIR